MSSVKIPTKYQLNFAWWFICCTHYIGNILVIILVVHYSCLYDSVIQGYFLWKPILVSGNFDCISRLWRRISLCCHLIGSLFGVPDYGAGNIPGCKFPHRKRTCALPWTMGLGWECMTLRSAWRHGLGDLGEDAWRQKCMAARTWGLGWGPSVNYRMYLT